MNILEASSSAVGLAPVPSLSLCLPRSKCSSLPSVPDSPCVRLPRRKPPGAPAVPAPVLTTAGQAHFLMPTVRGAAQARKSSFPPASEIPIVRTDCQENKKRN